MHTNFILISNFFKIKLILFSKIIGWKKKAIKLKLKLHPVLKSLLKSTGDALLVETCYPDDRFWSVCQDEKTLQVGLLKNSVKTTADLFLISKVEILENPFLDFGKRRQRRTLGGMGPLYVSSSFGGV